MFHHIFIKKIKIFVQKAQVMFKKKLYSNNVFIKTFQKLKSRDQQHKKNIIKISCTLY